MPSLRPLDGAETPTLFRPRHDDRWPVGRRGGSAERGVDLLQVVSVDFERLPSERAGPLRVWAGLLPDHRRPALAQAVHVDHDDEVVQAEVGRVLERFPYRAFGHFAVTA